MWGWWLFVVLWFSVFNFGIEGGLGWVGGVRRVRCMEMIVFVWCCGGGGGCGWDFCGYGEWVVVGGFDAGY